MSQTRTVTSSVETLDVAPPSTSTTNSSTRSPRLIPQLSSSSPPPTADELGELVDEPVDRCCSSPGSTGRSSGSLTLAFYRIPTGLKAWIEDVVVDAEAAATASGEASTLAALDEARRRGAKDVSLTSRPSREAANRLYLRLGFSLRDTNMYRYKFD